MNAEVQRLRAQIRDDRVALDRQFDLLTALAPRAGDPGVEARTALALHHAYAAVEAILERCTLALEGSKPGGPDCHRALLEVATLTIPGVREPLLGRDTVRRLHDLRSFRHFLHHGYGAELDPVRLEAVRAGALAVRSQLAVDLDSLDGRLAEIAALD